MRTKPIWSKAIPGTLAAAVFAGGVTAQQLTPNENNPNNTTIVNKEQQNPQKPLLGNDIPVFDPGSNNFTFDGQSWNIENNQLLRSRFEKYLSTKEANSTEDQAYRSILKDISHRALAPLPPDQR